MNRETPQNPQAMKTLVVVTCAVDSKVEDVMYGELPDDEIEAALKVNSTAYGGNFRGYDVVIGSRSSGTIPPTLAKLHSTELEWARKPPMPPYGNLLMVLLNWDD